MSFVTITEFAARYEIALPSEDWTRVETLLDDACALVTDIVGIDYEEVDEAGALVQVAPRAIAALVCTAVRRAYENPGNLQGETIGDYSWRVQYMEPGAAAMMGVYFTVGEQRIMRRAAGVLSARSVTLSAQLPAPAVDTEFWYEATGW